jgi:hypothetical protein
VKKAAANAGRKIIIQVCLLVHAGRGVVDWQFLLGADVLFDLGQVKEGLGVGRELRESRKCAWTERGHGERHRRKRLRDDEAVPLPVVVCQRVLTRHEVLQLVEVLGEEKVDVAKGSDEEGPVFKGWRAVALMAVSAVAASAGGQKPVSHLPRSRPRYASRLCSLVLTGLMASRASSCVVMGVRGG